MQHPSMHFFDKSNIITAESRNKIYILWNYNIYKYLLSASESADLVD